MERPQPSMAPPQGPLWMWVGGQALRRRSTVLRVGLPGRFGNYPPGSGWTGQAEGGVRRQQPAFPGLGLDPFIPGV